MTLAVQFQHLLAQPVPILPAPERAQPPARAGAVGAGFHIPTTEQLAATVPGCSQGDAAPKGLGSGVNKLMRTPRAGQYDYARRADRDTAGNTLPVPVLAELHVNNASAKLNAVEARESNRTGWGQNLAAGNSFCAGGGVESRHAGAKAEIGCREPVQADSLDRTSQTDPSGSSVPPARTSLFWSAVQLSESAYLETICDAIELADTADEFRVIRSAIAKVGGLVNRQSLRMMLELREKEVAHE